MRLMSRGTKCLQLQTLLGRCVLQDDATEHIPAVLDRIKPEYLVSMLLPWQVVRKVVEIQNSLPLFARLLLDLGQC